METKRFAVLGAGPMGLMSAMELLKQGHSVDIFERDDRIGGMSATFDFDGLEIERYYHFICKPDHSLFELLEELGLSDAVRWTDTKMGFFYNGRMYKWGTPLALLKFDGLDIISKLRYAMHVMRAKSINDWETLDKIQAVDWIKKWVGLRAYDVLWRSLFDLKFYEHANSLSAAWIGTRIKRVALSRKSLMQESLGYLEGGSATLLRAMQKFILDHGGKIHLKAGIERIITRNNKVQGVVVRDETIQCDGVLWTAPIQYVPQILPDLPADFINRINTIKNIPVACVILKLRQPFSENFWTNINDPTMGIPGLIEYSNLNQVGPAILYAPFYMPKTHPKWVKSNDELIEEVIGYLPRLNPAFRPEWIIGKYCHRYDFAQTICPPGFYAMLPPMRTPIEGFYMADTSYYYPEDRSISESAKVGRILAQQVSGTH
ncbi:MAG: NAD(P)/FAD-dependent oxidoreductase [Gammaproteobacteria bacterium]